MLSIKEVTYIIEAVEKIVNAATADNTEPKMAAKWLKQELNRYGGIKTRVDNTFLRNLHMLNR